MFLFGVEEIYFTLDLLTLWMLYFTSQFQSAAFLYSVLYFALSGPAVHKHQFNSNAVTDINLDNVCKKGNTLLWDIVQDDDAVSC